MSTCHAGQKNKQTTKLPALGKIENIQVTALLATVSTVVISGASTSKSSSSSSSSASLLTMQKNLISLLSQIALRNMVHNDARSHKASASSAAAAASYRRPMRPVDPIPVNSVDYVAPIINLLNSMREAEHKLKKRTYSYGLMVVGRPLEELTIPQRLVRAALSPSKYYQDISMSLSKQLNHISDRASGKASHKKYYSPTGKSSKSPKSSSLDWSDVLLRLISIAASSMPTPVVRS